MQSSQAISCVTGALCIAIASVARAGPGAVGLQVGLPIPLTVYGINTQSESISTRRPLYGAIDADFAVSPRWCAGGRLGGMTLVGVNGSSEADAWFISGGLQVTWRPRLDWPWRISLGPSLLRNAVIIDENIRLDTWAWGARASSGFGWPVYPQWAIDLDAGLEAYRPPWNKNTFFNKPLGRSVLMTIAVGVRWSK